MEKALVIGGGGFVGEAVVRQLLGRGLKVAVVGRRPYPALGALGVNLLQGDIRDADFLLKALQGYDTVFHVAAKAGIWGRRNDFEAINIEGARNVISGCLANRVATLVYTSTPSVVFNRRDLCGADETISYPARYLCYYAATKAIAEQLVLAADSPVLKTCALRPHLVWGPGDPHLVPRLLARGRRRLLKQVGDGRNLVDITYVDNAAHAHLLAADNLEHSGSAAGQAYFISDGLPVNLWDWINQLFERTGMPPISKKVSYHAAFMAGAFLEGVYTCLGIEKEPIMTRFLAEQLARSHWFSVEKARNDLGYAPLVSSEEGLERLLAWLAGENDRC